MLNKVAAVLVEDPDKDLSEARCDAIKARPDFKEEVTFNKKMCSRPPNVGQPTWVDAGDLTP